MSSLLLVATRSGLVVCEREGLQWRHRLRALEAHHVTSIIAREGVILAGTKSGVFRSDDLGENWKAASAGLAISYVRWLDFHPDVSDLEFAGTEPAGIFVSGDGAETWRECPEVAALRDAHEWFLPYSPAAGCVRGFAFHGTRGYAAVEVGGLLRSDDRGGAWRLVGAGSDRADFDAPGPPFLYPDVHSVAVHPSSPDFVVAATGDGLYGSNDGGNTWRYLYENCYCRAVWLDPANPVHMILGPADSVSRNGRIEETVDGGATWRLAVDGLETPWPRRMVERFARVEDDLIAVLSDGDMVMAPLASLKWRSFPAGMGKVEAVTAMDLNGTPA